jgi:hypothetical protein
MKTTSKFGPFKDNRPFDEKTLDFLQSLLFWRGRKKGMIYTRDITWDDIRAVFFPENFYEKYKYLGSVPYREDGSLFKALYPLVLAMDYEAKPKGCPRWFLRFLYLFGSDNSIIRVRNRTLHNLVVKLTKGIMMNDYKTKWADYDLRISVNAPEHLHNLANAIEREYFSQGRQKELAEKIKELDPNASIIWGDVNRLVKQYNDLKDKTNEDVYDYIS